MAKYFSLFLDGHNFYLHFNSIVFKIFWLTFTAHSWYLRLWAGGWKSARWAAFFTFLSLWVLYKSRHVFNAYACDDLLRQYHLFTALHHFCRESENLLGGVFGFLPISQSLHYHFNSNPSANFRSYKSNIKQTCNSLFYMYKYSWPLYSMKVLPIY